MPARSRTGAGAYRPRPREPVRARRTTLRDRRGRVHHPDVPVGGAQRRRARVRVVALVVVLAAGAAQAAARDPSTVLQAYTDNPRSGRHALLALGRTDH